MIKIRRPSEDEIPALARIWYTAWHDGHAAHVPAELTAIRTEESFRIRLADMLVSTRIAAVDGKPVGFCSLKGDELYQIMVSAEARGTPAATALMTNAEARLRAGGTEVAWLSCVIGNERAAAFYRKSGWHLARTFVEELATLDAPYPLEVWRFEKVLKRELPPLT
ncbi:GNAT family N-acetyltransferase [Minwuia sp.]|uniref:GNAT family N-acetyltransferase n=1 Tax=Minwuia sp. TaxID=2493630 RepID=UPI003A8DC82F